MSKIYVAITGGIGSGKSLALQFLRELNYPVFSCDELYKQIIQSNEYIEKVAKSFPEAVKNGQIERSVLSQIIFNSEEKRKQLNNLAHPMIMDLLFRQMESAEGRLAFAEVPLLFEESFENLFDKVIYVTRDKAQRIHAVINRDGLSRAAIEKRMDCQFDATSDHGKKRLKNCNAKIINNDSDMMDFKREILEFVDSL